MASSSSSDSVEAPLTIVVSPVEITVISVSKEKLAAELEALATKFDMPVATLVTSGCLRVFRGEPLELVVTTPDVRARL